MKAYMKTLIQFLRYSLVGGAAFIVDAGTLWCLERFVHYLAAAAIAFVAGLIVNYILSKLFVFTDKVGSPTAEFITYAVIGVIGLGFTELLMYFFTDMLGIYFLLSKIITAALVLIWNFAARKIILYRRS